MRPPTACVACRTRRRKCPPTAPGQPCAHCLKRNIPCTLASTNGNANASTAGREAASTSDDITTTPSPTALVGSRTSAHAFGGETTSSDIRMPPLDVCVDLGSLYFRYIHDTFHSLFHQPSIEDDIANGSLPPVVLLGIISLASRFSQEPFFDGIDPRVRGQPYAKEAQRLLDLREVSVTTIQACVLLGAFVITEGGAAAESLYYSVACRLAMLIDLPNLRVRTRLEQETNIRLWWTLNMVDVWSSNGVGLPRSIVPRHDIPYPMDDSVFLDMRRSDPEPPALTTAEESSQSLLTQMVLLNAILYEISDLNKSIASDYAGTPPSGYLFDDRVDILGRKLHQWWANLPPRLRDTQQNLDYWASIGLGHLFVAVYLGYYHFGQLLYYQYLSADLLIDDEDEAGVVELSHASRYATQCKIHATNLCEILYRAYSTPWCDVYYSMVGHVLVVASTVQLFMLLFSSEEAEVTAARERLGRNFEILTQLQTYWPSVDHAVSRFREFHNACFDEKQRKESFRMDQWMMKFQFEFANPISERPGSMASSPLE